MKKDTEGEIWIGITMISILITMFLMSGCQINTDKIKEDLVDDPLNFLVDKVADNFLEKYNLTEEDIIKIKELQQTQESITEEDILRILRENGGVPSE